MMESASEDIHDALNSVDEVQTHFRLREAQGRVFAENLNERVFYWSLGEFFIIMSIGIGQVFILKGFFTDKKTASGIMTS